MNRHYSLQEKEEALARLAQNAGNSVLTATQLGIPERTLRGWRQQAWISHQLSQSSAAALAASSLRQPPPPSPHRRQPHQTGQHPENDLAALENMRAQILDALTSVNDWQEIFAFMSPYQKAQISILLLDRLMKLDEHLKPYRPKSPVRLRVIGSEGEEPDDDHKPNPAGSPSPSEGNSRQ